MEALALCRLDSINFFFFFFQAEDGIRDFHVTGVQTCALPIYLADIENNEYVKQVKEYAANENAEVVVICAKIEAEIAELDGEEKKLFLEELGIEESGLDQLIKVAYKLLGLATFFTAGEKEVRAWTFRKGMKAPEAAGIIHSDFERGFIRA